MAAIRCGRLRSIGDPFGTDQRCFRRVVISRMLSCAASMRKGSAANCLFFMESPFLVVSYKPNTRPNRSWAECRRPRRRAYHLRRKDCVGAAHHALRRALVLHVVRCRFTYVGAWRASTSKVASRPKSKRVSILMQEVEVQKKRRRRVKQTMSLGERLLETAREAREIA